MNTRAYLLGCLCGLVLSQVGCTPRPSDSQRRISWAGGSVYELKRISRLRNEGLYFSTYHLLAMVGEPELKVKMSELASLLEQDHGGHDREYSEEKMVRLYLQYSTALQMRRQNVDAEGESWRDSKTFNSLQAWLYNYKDPPEIIVGGIPPRGRGVFGTTCFLVDNATVVAQCPLSRTFKKKR